MHRGAIILAMGTMALCGRLAAEPARDSPKLAASAVVSALDERIQLRFRDPELGTFGFTRMCPPDVHQPLTARDARTSGKALPKKSTSPFLFGNCGAREWAPFEPRNREEEWIKKEALKSDVEVWMLLVGVADGAVQGPVVLGSAEVRDADLQKVQGELVRRAARLPVSESGFEAWQVAVRPVRARAECMSCHDPALRKSADGVDTHLEKGGLLASFAPNIPGLKVGSPIAYLVYFHRQADSRAKGSSAPPTPSQH
jgi:hypothetical protein